MEGKTVAEYLNNLKENYLRQKKEDRFLPPMYKAKCIGAMEALLIVLGGLSKYEVYDYKTKEVNVNLIFWKFTRTRRETHEEYVLRKVDEIFAIGKLKESRLIEV